MASRARGRGFGPCLAKLIVKWTHSAQNLAQPFLSPVTFSEVLAGLQISCGRGFGPRLAKFVVTWVRWTHFGQNLARPFLLPVTFNEVLAGPPVTFSEVFSYLGGPGGSRAMWTAREAAKSQLSSWEAPPFRSARRLQTTWTPSSKDPIE